MSVDRSELHQLIDELPKDQLALAADDLRRRAQPRPARTSKPFAWVGAIDDSTIPADVASNVDLYLATYGFGRDSL